MKKIILGVALFMGAITLIACNGKKVNGNVHGSKENVFAVSAVSGVDAVSNINLANLSQTLEDVVEHEIDKDHINTMLGMLNDDSFKVESEKSDREDFETLLNITLNKSRNFKFYFTETLVKGSEKVDEDETEIEEEYTIKGLIVENEVEYTVVGTREVEIEVDGKEREEEFELELTISLNKSNYTKVKYETEAEIQAGKTELEKEYKISVYEEGKEVTKIKMDFEVENDELELKLAIEENGKVSTYELEINDKDQKAIVKYTIKEDNQVTKGEIEINIVIDKETKAITYVYGNPVVQTPAEGNNNSEADSNETV